MVLPTVLSTADGRGDECRQMPRNTHTHTEAPDTLSCRPADMYGSLSVDVARESADMVVLTDDFSSIVQGIEQGTGLRSLE